VWDGVNEQSRAPHIRVHLSLLLHLAPLGLAAGCMFLGRKSLSLGGAQCCIVEACRGKLLGYHKPLVTAQNSRIQLVPYSGIRLGNHTPRTRR
jgi:hypothetical protein